MAAAQSNNHNNRIPMTNKQGRLYLVGVGPGDPELMTCKAVRILRDCAVWIAPKASETGSSSAVAIAAGQVELNGREVLELHFPMIKVRLGMAREPELLRGWRQAAAAVLSHLRQGRDVAFPTLGDPSFYSTAFYLLATLQEMANDLEVTVVPGVPAMAACAADVCLPLGLGDDLISVVPAAFDDARLRSVLAGFDTIILMKVHRSLDRIVALLEELGLLDRSVLIERCGLDGQRIYRDARQALGRDLHYFSTLLVRKRGLEDLL